MRLPHMFSWADDEELVAVGHGVTQKEASEDVCCTAMTKLFCADASNIVLRPKHWNVSLPALLEGCMTLWLLVGLALCTSLWQCM